MLLMMTMCLKTAAVLWWLCGKIQLQLTKPCNLFRQFWMKALRTNLCCFKNQWCITLAW